MTVLLPGLLGTGCTEYSSDRKAVRIGTPDGTARLLAECASNKLTTSAEVTILPEMYEYFDCCASSTQWALSSGSLDAAILCPNEARNLIDADDRYVIAGPCMVNSIVVLVKDGSKTDTIGFSQNRTYEDEVIERLFGEECHKEPMLIQALPSAYARGLVDGIVIDLDTAAWLQGTKLPVNRPTDVITYMLVVRNDFPYREQVVKAFSAAADELNDADCLRQALEGKGFSSADASEWLETGLRFVAGNNSLQATNNEGDLNEVDVR